MRGQYNDARMVFSENWVMCDMVYHRKGEMAL